MEILAGRIYRHFKGDYYVVEGFAIDSETQKRCVIYRSLYGEGTLYVRDYEMFASFVDKQKYPEVEQAERFALQEVKSIRE